MYLNSLNWLWTNEIHEIWKALQNSFHLSRIWHLQLNSFKSYVNLSKNIPLLIAAKNGHNFHFCFWYLFFILSWNLNKLIKIFGLGGNVFVFWSSFKCSQEESKNVDFESLKHKLWLVSVFMHRTVGHIKNCCSLVF